MLVIKRRRDQRLLIGEGIEIVVLELSDYDVKLGIAAPDEVRILRAEVAGAEAEGVIAARGQETAKEGGRRS